MSRHAWAMAWQLSSGLLVFFLMLSSARAESDIFFMERASLLMLEEHSLLRSGSIGFDAVEDEAFLLAGHRLTGGETIVAGVRTYYERSGVGAFSKLTIRFPQGLSDGAGRLEVNDDTDLLVYYSFGDSAKPSAGCFGYARAGYIEYRFVDRDNLELGLHLTIDNIGTKTRPKCKNPKEIDVTLSAGRVELDALTPWLGRLGKTFEHESRR